MADLNPCGSLYLCCAEEGQPMISSSFSWIFIPGGCNSSGPFSKPSCRNLSHFVLPCSCHRFVSRSEQKTFDLKFESDCCSLFTADDVKAGKVLVVQSREAEREEWKHVHQRYNFLLQAGKYQWMSHVCLPDVSTSVWGAFRTDTETWQSSFFILLQQRVPLPATNTS